MTITRGGKILKEREDEAARLRAIIKAAKKLQKSEPPTSEEGALPDVISSIRQRQMVRDQLASDVAAWEAAGNQIERLPARESAYTYRPARAYDRRSGGAWNAE